MRFAGTSRKFLALLNGFLSKKLTPKFILFSLESRTEDSQETPDTSLANIPTNAEVLFPELPEQPRLQGPSASGSSEGSEDDIIVLADKILKPKEGDSNLESTEVT